MTSRVDVVEPTLEGYSGHCHALVANVVRAAAEFSVELWSGRGSADMTFGSHLTIHPLFRRRLRPAQMLFLLRRLLRGPGKILVTTARRSDLVLLDVAARGRVPPDKVFLYFHWFRATPRKLSFLRRMAARQPETVILGTTSSVVDVFRSCGYANVVLLPYPAPPPARDAEAVPFRRLLYAGAARQDKGFGIVVDLVQLLAAREETLPIAVQITAEYYGKSEATTRADIARLEGVHYAPLSLIRETPSPDEYAANFPGSICLQPYDRAEFRDRVSGVTLDALVHGCPIVATAGTWSADMIEPFGAGIALADPNAERLYGAAIHLRADYARYQAAAFAAARAPGRDSWGPLLERLRS